MSYDEEISQISTSLGQLQDELAKAAPAAANPELRQFIESMSEKLQEGRGQFADVYKSASAKADERLAKVKQQSKSLAEQVSAAEKKLAGLAVPSVPAVPIKPPFTVDRELGQKLRQELLDRFAPNHAEADQRAWEGGREAWDDWAGWSQN